MLTITLTETQKDAVDVKAQHVLIKGIPGSGKTTVLIKRIEMLLKSKPEERILFITYNRTLVNYLKQTFESNGIKSDNLIIATYHSWASNVVKGRLNSNYKKIAEIEESVFNKVKKSTSHRFFVNERGRGFLTEEVEWIKGNGISSLEEYLKVKRTGRGQGLNKNDRATVFEYLSLLNEKLKSNNLTLFSDYANIVYEQIEMIKEQQAIDHVFIDEAQDLTQMQLITLRKAAAQSITVAADLGQKIYRTEFTWRSVGIQVQGGRTKTLAQAYRSSKEIMDLANSLIVHDPLLKDLDELPLYETDNTTGVKPYLIKTENPSDEFEVVARMVKKEFEDGAGKISIGVLSYTSRTLYGLKHKIAEFGVPVEIVERDQGNVLKNGAKLMTMHGAKGLEFDAVIITRLTEKNYPKLLDEDDSDANEEQINIARRLLYVSMTRAKSNLFLTYYGKPSRFINELDEYLLTRA